MNNEQKDHLLPSASLLQNGLLAAGIHEPSEIVEKAIRLLQPINFEPHNIGYYVCLNGDDMGNEDYCENCIKDVVKAARKFHKEQRQKVLEKFKQIHETGCFKIGKKKVVIKDKYTEKEITKAKRYELKKYPAKANFTYEGHDPDFGGGEKSAKTCDGCGEYFYTNFEPDEEEANYLLEEYNDGSEMSESFKWKLDIAFYNYDYLDQNVQKVLLSIAEKIAGVS